MEFPNINQIKDEAALWVVKLQGHTYKTGHGVPADEAEALKDWLAQSDTHRDCFIKTLSAWDAMGVLEELADILPLADAPVSSPHRASGSVQNPQPASASGGFFPVTPLAQLAAWCAQLIPARKPASLAWSGVAGVFSVALVWALLLAPQEQQYQTRIGEQASYTLADGSVLTLNTNSEVQVAYTDSRRVVTLSKGEANFEVSKDQARPFVVYAGEGMVWAVGTAFNVDYRKTYVDVLVSEGRVKVFSGVSPEDSPQLVAQSIAASYNNTQPPTEAPADTATPRLQLMLGAGEAVQFSDVIQAKDTLAQNQLEKRLAWQTGALHFEGETLAEAIVEINRYTEQQLVIVDPSIVDLRVGGRFKADDIDSLLSALAKSLNIRISEGEGKQVLFSAK